MKLKTYLSKRKISMTKFANLIDRNTSTVSRLCAEETQPDWPTMNRILLVTKGQVQPNDFIQAV
jgi:plasmid maintenance system antidote protein VapI